MSTDITGENKIEIGHVSIIDLDKEKQCGFSKRLEIDFEGPYFPLSKFDEIRIAIEEVFLRHIKENNP